jgi:hypothetical protein
MGGGNGRHVGNGGMGGRRPEGTAYGSDSNRIEPGVSLAEGEEAQKRQKGDFLLMG